MFNFLTKIDVDNIPAVRALFNCVSSMFTYSLLIWLIVLANFSWAMVLIAFIGIMATTFYSFLEDKKTIKMGEYKLSHVITLFPFVNLLVFWILIFYLCLNVKLENSIVLVVALAFLFSFIQTLSSSLVIPHLTKSLKRASDIHNGLAENKISVNDAIERIEKENHNMKKQIIKVILFTFVPSVLSMIFLWLAFYQIFINMNVPIQLVLYAIFVVIIEIILSNFAKKLKKELINKIILKTNE